MGKRCLWTVLSVLLLCACSGQSKEELLNSGTDQLRNGNTRGAIVYLKNALALDPDYIDARLQLGNAYFVAGQYQQAEHEFEKVLIQNAHDSELLLKLAQVYRHTQRFDKSVEILNLFHQDNPPSSLSLDLLGVSNALLGQHEIADPLFVESTQLDQENPLPRYHLAQSYLGQSRQQEATAVLEAIVDDFPNFTDAYELLAELYLSESRVDDAIEIYRRLTTADPQNAQALYVRGVLLLTLGRADDAQEVIALYGERFPADYRGEQLLGLEAYKAERFDDALVHLRQSLKATPHTLTYYYLGLSHFQQGEFELAVNQYQRVLDAQPGSSQARLMLAMTFLQQKRVDDCLQQTRYVLKDDPENGLAHSILGSAYLLQKQYDDALNSFTLAIEFDPGLIDAHLKKGQSYALQGEADMAEKELVAALSKSPHVLNTRLLLASYHVRMHKFNSAEAVLRDGLTGSSGDALLYVFMAGIAKQQKIPENTVTYLMKAKQSAPEYQTPYLMLASSYLEQGKSDQAINEYQSLLANNPDNVTALVELGLAYELSGDIDSRDATFARLGTIKHVDASLHYARYQVREGEPRLAIEILDQGLALDSGNDALVREKIGILLQQGRVDEASPLLEQLEKAEPGIKTRQLVQFRLNQKKYEEARELAVRVKQSNSSASEGVLLLAAVLEAEGDLPQALALVDNQLSSDPNNAELLLRSALLHEKMNDDNASLSLLLELIDRYPRFYPAHFALGAHYDRLGDDDAALKFYQKTLLINNTFIPAINNLAYLLIENDRADESIPLALQAYRLAPGEPGILDTLGVSLLKNKRLGESSRILERARNLSQGNPTIRFHLALAYLGMQRPDLASVELERALESGAFPEAGQCRELLKRINS